MSKERQLVSMVVPVYNEAEVIETFLTKLYEVLHKIRYKFEVIIVDDGSTDGTLEVLKKARNRYPSIKLISFTRNFGHQYALWAGMERSEGAAIIMMDSDLQHPPALIPVLIKHWESGALVVQTIRNDADVPFWKKLTSRLFYHLINLLSDIKINPASADFRLLDRAVVAQLLVFRENDIILRGLIPWLGFKTVFVEYHVDQRMAGKSKYSLAKKAKLAVTGITALSTVPLKLTAIAGLLISLISFGIGIQAIYTKLFTNTAVTGWTSIMVGIFFIGGLSMIFMGVLGEYLGKVFMEVKGRPKFIIDKVFGFHEEGQAD